MATDWSTALVEQIAERVYDRISQHISTDSEIFRGQLTFDEQQAADILGIPRHVLKGCRERGEIHPRKIGKKWQYSRTQICQFADNLQ